MLKGRQKNELKTAQPYLIPDEIQMEKPAVEPVQAQNIARPDTHHLMASTDPGNASMMTKVTPKEVIQPVHTVSTGDTLFGIARNYGLSVDDLKKRNNLSADTIMIGQKLIVQ
jgi:LysM repeat protein